MAIAFDTSSVATLANPATSVTWSHTTASGTDRFMAVGGGIPTSDKLTSVTYNGTACTQVGSFQIASSRGCYLHYLVAPDTGTNNVVISGSSDAWIGAAATYTGVDQSSPIDTNNQGNSGGSAASLSISLTTTADNCWLAGSGRSGISTWNDATNGVVLEAANGFVFSHSNGAITPAGVTSQEFDPTANATIGAISMAFKPSAAAATRRIFNIS